MFLEKYCKKSLYKAIDKHYEALNPFNSKFFILHQYALMVVYDINIFYLILVFGVFCQNKAYFIITKHLHLSDYVF